jgi:hypothetical protein
MEYRLLYTQVCDGIENGAKTADWHKNGIENSVKTADGIENRAVY